MTPEGIAIFVGFIIIAYFAVTLILADWLNDNNGYTLLWGVWLPLLVICSVFYGLFKGFQWLKRGIKKRRREKK